MADPANYKGLGHLGQASAIPSSPEAAVLERVPNPHAGTLYLTRFVAPEFTSLCPVTGQPDFAHLVIDYAPGDWLVESKSLKLYLTSFRNHGAFHEDCTVSIGMRIHEFTAAKWRAFPDTGIRAVAFRSMYSGSPAPFPKASMCRNRRRAVSRPGLGFPARSALGNICPGTLRRRHS